jgi:hypothetical protein
MVDLLSAGSVFILRRTGIERATANMREAARLAPIPCAEALGVCLLKSHTRKRCLLLFVMSDDSSLPLRPSLRVRMDQECLRRIWTMLVHSRAAHFVIA